MKTAMAKGIGPFRLDQEYPADVDKIKRAGEKDFRELFPNLPDPVDSEGRLLPDRELRKIVLRNEVGNEQYDRREPFNNSVGSLPDIVDLFLNYTRVTDPLTRQLRSLRQGDTDRDPLETNPPPGNLGKQIGQAWDDFCDNYSLDMGQYNIGLGDPSVPKIGQIQSRWLGSDSFICNTRTVPEGEVDPQGQWSALFDLFKSEQALDVNGRPAVDGSGQPINWLDPTKRQIGETTGARGGSQDISNEIEDFLTKAKRFAVNGNYHNIPVSQINDEDFKKWINMSQRESTVQGNSRLSPVPQPTREKGFYVKVRGMDLPQSQSLHNVSDARRDASFLRLGGGYREAGNLRRRLMDRDLMLHESAILTLGHPNPEVAPLKPFESVEDIANWLFTRAPEQFSTLREAEQKARELLGEDVYHIPKSEIAPKVDEKENEDEFIQRLRKRLGG